VGEVFGKTERGRDGRQRRERKEEPRESTNERRKSEGNKVYKGELIIETYCKYAVTVCNFM